MCKEGTDDLNEHLTGMWLPGHCCWVSPAVREHSLLTGSASAVVEKELLFLVKKYLVIDRAIHGTYAHHVFLWLDDSSELVTQLG